MAAELIKVTINEHEYEVDKGARLIDVCREKGFGIPSFCYYQDLELQASCRMCLVRIEKMPKLQTSCTIICQDGMVTALPRDPARVDEVAREHRWPARPVDRAE